MVATALPDAAIQTSQAVSALSLLDVNWEAYPDPKVVLVFAINEVAIRITAAAALGQRSEFRVQEWFRDELSSVSVAASRSQAFESCSHILPALAEAVDNLPSSANVAMLLQAVKKGFRWRDSD